MARSRLALSPRLEAVRRLAGNHGLQQTTAAASALFFAFVGAFSFITFRLEAPPFGWSEAAGGLIFLLWAMGVVGPVAGTLADSPRRPTGGWPRRSTSASTTPPARSARGCPACCGSAGSGPGGCLVVVGGAALVVLARGASARPVRAP